MSVLFIFFLMSLLLLRPLPTDARGWVVIGKLILRLYRAGQSAMTKLGLRGQPRPGHSPWHATWLLGQLAWPHSQNEASLLINTQEGAYLQSPYNLAGRLELIICLNTKSWMAFNRMDICPLVLRQTKLLTWKVFKLNNYFLLSNLIRIKPLWLRLEDFSQDKYPGFVWWKLRNKTFRI